MCSICKTRFSPESGIGIKGDIFKQWDAYLFIAYRRQWDFQQAKNAKREAARTLERRQGSRSG